MYKKSILVQAILGKEFSKEMNSIRVNSIVKGE